MAGENGMLFGRHFSSAQQEAAARRSCCCSRIQYRAAVLMLISLLFILLSQFLNIAAYLVFLGSIGLFIGIFLCLLDATLFLQARRERTGNRFGSSGDEEGRNGSIWTTSLNARNRRLSFDGDPPDYATISTQPESFPFPSYLEQGVPATVLSSPREPAVLDGETEDDAGMSGHGDDKLPSYEEVMNGSLPAPSVQQT